METICNPDEDSQILDFSDLIHVEDSSVTVLKSCLDTNQRLQQRLREYRQRIQNELINVVGIEDLNTDEQDNPEEEDFKGGLNPLHINSLTPFLTPYFHDIRGFSAPENSDTQLKKSRGEIQQAYLLPCKSWSRIEEQELKRLVTSDNVRRLTESLSNEKSKLYNDYKNLQQFPNEDWTNEQLENGLREIQEKIDDINATIRSFHPEDNVPSREESECLDWLRISAQMSTSRDDTACKVHWMNVMHPSINHDPWTEEEDEELASLAEELHFDWNNIAEHFSTPSKVRLGWQCMEEFQSKLNPEMKLSGPLTKSEAAFLDNVIEMCRIGDYIPWHQVKYFVEGRSVTQLKHYWMKKTSLKRGDVWTKLEDEVLVAAVLRHGKDDWTNVASHIYGRTNRQCRERYMLRLNVIDRRIGGWTKEEDLKLIELAKKHKFKWAELERNWTGRNAKQLSHRYELLTSWLKDNDSLLDEDSLVSRYTRTVATTNRDSKDIEQRLIRKLGVLNEEKLDAFLKGVKNKLIQAHETKDLLKGRKRKTTEEEDIDDQLAELFSIHSMLSNVESGALTRGVLDQIVRDETKSALNNILSGKELKVSHPLSKVIKLALEESVTNKSDSGHSSNSSFAILPPNRSLVRGIHNLILLQDFLIKKAPSDDSELDNLEDEKQTASYQLLLRRFYSCFLWPSFLSNSSVPSEPQPEEPSEPRIKKNMRQIKQQRSVHAVNIAKCRDDQILLINSATGDTKLQENLKMIELTSKSSQESISSQIERINCVTVKQKKAKAVKSFVTSVTSSAPKRKAEPKKKEPEVAQGSERKSSRLGGKRVRVK